MMTHEEETREELWQMRRQLAVKERAPLDGRVVDEMEYRRSVARLRELVGDLERELDTFGDAA